MIDIEDDDDIVLQGDMTLEHDPETGITEIIFLPDRVPTGEQFLDVLEECVKSNRSNQDYLFDQFDKSGPSANTLLN